MKWYTKLWIILLVIVFSPLILGGLLIAAIGYFFGRPKDKKAYRNSFYYKEFGLPFRSFRLYSPEYRFLNHAKARNLSVNYIRQASTGLEYFIYEHTLFLFPDFDQIDFDEEKAEWQVDYDGDWKNFEQAYQSIVSKMDIDAPDFPVKLLVERKMFVRTNLNGVSIPECIFLTWDYETAFENEDSPLKLIVPTDPKELYGMMLATPGLCGKFQIGGNGNIDWDLYETIQIEIGVNPQDCYLGITRKMPAKMKSSITHWHPTSFEIYNEVCKIGRRGNVLVIRSFMGGAGVLYMGDEASCPYSADKRVLLGKYYYLKAN